jgi:hypothetical protein
MATKKVMATAKIKTFDPPSQMDTVARDADFKSLYVNNVNFGMTRFDFQMVLGLVEITRDTANQKVRELASVKMTIPYAKALVKDMGAVVEAYEREYGEIVLPPEITKKP